MRYRYDAQRKKRFKTVELIVAERNWEPPVPRVRVRIEFAEVDMRERVKQFGGKWNRGRKVSEVRYSQVLALKLEDRILEDGASTNRCLGLIST